MIQFAAQYPHEKEITFPPLSGLQVLSTRVEDRRLIIETRLSLNTNSQTLEAIDAKLKTSLTQLIDIMNDELTNSGVPVRIVSKLIELRERAEEEEPEYFKVVSNFRAMINEALHLYDGAFTVMADPDTWAQSSEDENQQQVASPHRGRSGSADDGGAQHLEERMLKAAQLCYRTAKYDEAIGILRLVLLECQKRCNALVDMGAEVMPGAVQAGLYELVYSMGTLKPPNNKSEEMYNLACLDSPQIVQIVAGIAKEDSVRAVHLLARSWQQHQRFNQVVDRAFSYINRFYVRRLSLPAIHEALTQRFFKAVLAQPSSVKPIVRKGILQLCKQGTSRPLNDEEREALQVSLEVLLAEDAASPSPWVSVVKPSATVADCTDSNKSPRWTHLRLLMRSTRSLHELLKENKRLRSGNTEEMWVQVVLSTEGKVVACHTPFGRVKCTPQLQDESANGAGLLAQSENVTLISKEEEMLHVNREDIGMSTTLVNMMDSMDNNMSIPVAPVSTDVLIKVIEYMAWHRQARADELAEDEKSAFDNAFVEDLSDEALFNMILAANYLDIQQLLDLTCKCVADQVKGKSPEEIRIRFNIKNDFTPEEEEEVQRENAWCEER